MMYKNTIWMMSHETLAVHSEPHTKEGWTIRQMFEGSDGKSGILYNIIWQKTEPQKVRSVKPFVPPTIEEIEAFIKERGYNINARDFFRYYAKADWTDSQGKKVRNWKSKMIHNWVHDEPQALKEDYLKPKT